MAQVGRPRGLIDYTTYENAEREQRGEPPRSLRRTVLRPRTIIYFSLWGWGLRHALRPRARARSTSVRSQTQIQLWCACRTVQSATVTWSITHMDATTPISSRLRASRRSDLGEGGTGNRGPRVPPTVAPVPREIRISSQLAQVMTPGSRLYAARLCRCGSTVEGPRRGQTMSKGFTGVTCGDDLAFFGGG